MLNAVKHPALEHGFLTAFAMTNAVPTRLPEPLADRRRRPYEIKNCS